MPYQTPGFPTSSRLITVSVPDTLEMYFWGALSELVFPWNWEAWGAMTPEETAEIASPLVEEINLTDTFAVIPPNGVAGQLLSKANDINNDLAWLDQTLSPPAGIAYAKNIASLHPYAYWVQPHDPWLDPNSLLTNGFIASNILDAPHLVAFENLDGYIAVVFDFGEPIRALSADIWGVVCEDEGIYYPVQLTVSYSDDLVDYPFAVGVTTEAPGTGDRQYHFSVDIPWAIGPHRYWLVVPYTGLGVGLTFLSEVQLFGIQRLP